MVLVVCLLTAFYQIENWRGRSAWGAFKAGQERRGIVMELQKLIPPPIPDHLNAYKAPRMMRWFGKSGNNELYERLGAERVFNNPIPEGSLLAKIDVWPLAAQPAAPEADISLSYMPPLVVDLSDLTGETPLPGMTPLPLIMMDDVPLPDAIRNLARQCDLNYLADPQLRFGEPQPGVSLRYENVTVWQVLTAVLNNYHLEIVDDPRSRISIIRSRPQGRPGLHFAGDAAKRLRELLLEYRPPEPSGPGIQKLRAASGDFVLFSGNSSPTMPRREPARILLQSQSPVSVVDLQEFMKATGAFAGGQRIAITPSGTNAFAVSEVPPSFCSAADYLACTKRFQKELDIIRAALDRPLVRLDGSYGSVLEPPVPNFVLFRRVGQLLVQRAQAHLLLDQPAEAVEEIHLIHNLCGLLENKPSGKPTTLVAAMIRVALTGLYTTTIAEGFQLGKWREPQLRELQEMLSTVRLASAVDGAMTLDRVAVSQSLEAMRPGELAWVYVGKPEPATTLEKLKSPLYWFIKLAPRGWVYQNLLTSARLRGPLTPVYDPTTDVVDPSVIDQGFQKRLSQLHPFSPYHMLAVACTPNFVRAWETMARNQALVAQATLACALERYRLAHGDYPIKLQDLVPEYAKSLPRDIMTGELLRYARTAYGQFRLYSVGWNRVDDGGQPGASAEKQIGNDDWTWPQYSPRASDVTGHSFLERSAPPTEPMA